MIFIVFSGRILGMNTMKISFLKASAIFFLSLTGFTEGQQIKEEKYMTSQTGWNT